MAVRRALCSRRRRIYLTGRLLFLVFTHLFNGVRLS
jgi:hypothetical protein